MGMFDTVICEVPLPDGYVGKDFQTKDFDCELAYIKIAEDGRLMRCYYYGSGYTNYEELKWKDKPFHGVMCFYDYDNPSGITGPDNPFRYEDWHEYEAKFTDGILQEITQVNK